MREAAFPSHGTMGEVAHEGMTLRDYFAAKVLPQVVAIITSQGKEMSPEYVLEAMKLPYKFADLLLQERDK